MFSSPARAPPPPQTATTGRCGDALDAALGAAASMRESRTPMLDGLRWQTDRFALAAASTVESSRETASGCAACSTASFLLMSATRRSVSRTSRFFSRKRDIDSSSCSCVASVAPCAVASSSSRFCSAHTLSKLSSSSTPCSCSTIRSPLVFSRGFTSSSRPGCSRSASSSVLSRSSSGSGCSLDVRERRRRSSSHALKRSRAARAEPSSPTPRASREGSSSSSTSVTTVSRQHVMSRMSTVRSTSALWCVLSAVETSSVA
mmetsp:Transcript_73852/g.196557  ORF Transcript_73852/g.196557 Transcript_73852/m.196557 type:complete len:261 (+) Transcript_73852:750-1532(+)